ncbi:MAG: hypothetical protein CME06_00925 [Gemmatimonadetes bacterium]|nr:hypothetical protein [Gemmatimonadota bacterium]
MSWIHTLLLGGALPGAALFLVELCETDPRLRRVVMGSGVVICLGISIVQFSSVRSWPEIAFPILLALFWQRAYARARERIV